MKKQSLLKTLSLILSLALLLQDISYAVPAPKPADVIDIRSTFIPESIGHINEARSFPESNLTLYLIQDAHVNESAQRNIASILDHLIEREKINTVFLEAGSGDDSLSALRNLAGRSERKEVAERFLRKGYIQGPDYLDITSEKPFRLWGVEDKSLYSQGLELYRQLKGERSAANAYLDRIDRAIKTLKVRIFDPDLYQFDQKVIAFSKNESSLAEHYQTLSAAAKEFDLGMETYTNFLALGQVRELEPQIDFNEANREQNAALKSLSPEDQEIFLKNFRDHRLDKAYGGNTRTLCDLYLAFRSKLPGLSVYPNLSKYFTYLEIVQRMDHEKLLGEIHSLETDLYCAYASKKDEMHLLEVSRQSAVLRRIVDLETTSDDVQSLERTAVENSEILEISGFINRKLMDLGGPPEDAVFLEASFDRSLKAAIEFYRLTRARDEKFIENILKKTAETDQTRAAFVAGGFHTENLKKILREKRLSYVSIYPRVLHETNRVKYEKILFNQKTAHAPTPIIAPKTVLKMWGVLPANELIMPEGPVRQILAKELSGARLANAPAKKVGRAQPFITVRTIFNNALVVFFSFAAYTLGAYDLHTSLITITAANFGTMIFFMGLTEYLSLRSHMISKYEDGITRTVERINLTRVATVALLAAPIMATMTTVGFWGVDRLLPKDSGLNPILLVALRTIGAFGVVWLRQQIYALATGKKKAPAKQHEAFLVMRPASFAKTGIIYDLFDPLQAVAIEATAAVFIQLYYAWAGNKKGFIVTRESLRSNPAYMVTMHFFAEVAVWAARQLGYLQRPVYYEKKDELSKSMGARLAVNRDSEDASREILRQTVQRKLISSQNYFNEWLSWRTALPEERQGAKRLSVLQAFSFLEQALKQADEAKGILTENRAVFSSSSIKEQVETHLKHVVTEHVNIFSELVAYLKKNPDNKKRVRFFLREIRHLVSIYEIPEEFDQAIESIIGEKLFPNSGARLATVYEIKLKKNRGKTRGLSITKAADLLGFDVSNFARFLRENPKNKAVLASGIVKQQGKGAGRKPKIPALLEKYENEINQGNYIGEAARIITEKENEQAVLKKRKAQSVTALGLRAYLRKHPADYERYHFRRDRKKDDQIEETTPENKTTEPTPGARLSSAFTRRIKLFIAGVGLSLSNHSSVSILPIDLKAETGSVATFQLIKTDQVFLARSVTTPKPAGTKSPKKLSAKQDLSIPKIMMKQDLKKIQPIPPLYAERNEKFVSDVVTEAKSRNTSVFSMLSEAVIDSDQAVHVFIDLEIISKSGNLSVWAKNWIREIGALKSHRPVLKNVYYHFVGDEEVRRKLMELPYAKEVLGDDSQEIPKDAVSVFLFSVGETKPKEGMRNIAIQEITDEMIPALAGTSYFAAITGKVKADDPNYAASYESLTGSSMSTDIILELWSGKASQDKYLAFSIRSVAKDVERAVRVAALQERQFNTSA